MVDSIGNVSSQIFNGSAANGRQSRGPQQALQAETPEQSEQRASAPQPVLRQGAEQINGFQSGNQLSNLQQTVRTLSTDRDQDINLDVEGLNPDFDEGPASAPQATAVGSRIDIEV